MAEHAYTMPGTRWAVLTLARLNGDILPAIAASGLLLLAMAGFLHPEQLRAPSGGLQHHTRTHAVLVASTAKNRRGA